MRKLILGTAGHIDHGKTTLVRALTGIDPDRLEEEKRRGITIDLGFARLPLGDGIEFGIVDVPGHEAFVRNMLAGATGVDLVLLVVAADEGVMPQTREHLAIVELLGVRAGVIAVTKADLVEREWLELVVDDIRAQLAGTRFAASAIVPVSSTTGEGLDALRSALAAAAADSIERSADDLFRLPIDRVFTVRGTGTVVTGTVWSGSVERDQTVRILPADATVRVRAVQVHGRDVSRATAGQRGAVALTGLGRVEPARGDVLVAGAGWEVTSMLTVRLAVHGSSTWSIRPRQRVRLHLGTAEVMARVVLFTGEALEPGETGWAQLRLEAPVVARAGDRFVLRSYSPVTTIGGGIIAEPAPPKRKRLSAIERDRLDTVVAGEPEAAILALIEASGWRGVDESSLAVRTSVPPMTVDEVLGGGDGLRWLRIGGRVFDASLAAAARDRLVDTVAHYHTEHPLRLGIDRDELRRALPPESPAPFVEWVLGRLLSKGVLEARAGRVAASGFEPELDEDQRRASDRIREILGAAGLTPPTISELPPELRERPDLRSLLRLLEHEGAIIALGTDLYLAADALGEAVATVRRTFEPGATLAPTDFRRALPISRKFLIPLLEHFDRVGITVRHGDTRVLAGA